MKRRCVGFLVFTFLVALSAPVLAQPETYSVVTAAHKKVRPSLVYIKANGYDKGGNEVTLNSTGFIVSETGKIVTVHHVLGQIDGKYAPYKEDFRITGRIGAKFGPEFPLEIIRRYPNQDLMILTLPDIYGEITPVCLSFDKRNIQEGTEIATSGFPAGLDYTTHKGKIEGKRGPRGRRGLWRTDVPFNSGQSGSPIYDMTGLVMGFAVGDIENAEGLNFFQPLHSIRSEVKQHASCDDGINQGAERGSGEEEISGEISACVAEAFEKRRSSTFRVDGSVRCPGGGCFLQSSSCNRRESLLRYTADPGYEIRNYRFVSESANDANNGPLTTKADGNSIVSIEKALICDPADRAGADGGWSSGYLEGEAFHSDLTALKEQIITECKASQ